MKNEDHKLAARGANGHRRRRLEVKNSLASSISACEPLIRTILVPVDFSDCSLEGLTYSVRLARELGARIIVVHITDLGPVMMTTDYGEYCSPRCMKAAENQCGDQMKGFLSRVDFDGVPVDTRAVAGYCPGAIHEIAATEGADLIVIATHGRTGLRRAVMGSVAEGTVRHAVCPVLVVSALPTARRIGLSESMRRSSLRIRAK
jgi:nucleotide-binding universal stress UspA family protein